VIKINIKTKTKIKKFLHSKNAKRIAIALIVIGIGIALRPGYLAWRFDWMQRQMLSSWQNTIMFNADKTVTPVGDDGSDVWEEDIYPDVDVNYVVHNMDGTITIPKIKLRMPIINKYTVSNLNIAPCTVIAGRKMGQIGNYVLAGHRSRVRGRHFNRIIELDAGDIIITENKTSRYTYQVTDNLLVTPEDTWVMNNVDDKKLITLITCDYRTDPTGRLIIRGELIGSEPIDNTE